MNRSALLLALALALSSTAGAEALLKPLPRPDMSRLDRAKAQELEQTRAEFEKAKVDLVGTALAQAYAMMGAAYARAGLYDAADVALYDATQIAPDDARWFYAQGVLARTRQQPAAALASFEKAVLLQADLVPARAALAAQLIEQGNLDRARTVVDQGIAKSANEPKLHALRAQIALDQRRYPDALAAVGEALKLDPGATQLYALQAQIHQARGDAAAATAARAKAGDRPPRMSDLLSLPFLPPQQAAAVAEANVGAATPAGANAGSGAPSANLDPMSQAAFFLVARNYDGARQQIDAALKARPGDPAVLAFSARVEAAAGNQATANARAADAVRAAPQSALALLTRGVVAETGGDENAARADYERAIALDPKLGEARLLLGNSLMRRNQSAQAVEQYRQLTKLDPTKPEHHARLVAAQVSAGRCAEALKDIDAALREQPRQALLVQLFVRVASTCPASNSAEKSMALDLGNRVYKQLPTPGNSEALALAAASGGRFDDARDLQSAAIFAAVRDAGEPAAEPYREFLRRFEAKQMPDKPWPSTHPLFKPPAMRPEPAATPSTPAKP